MDPSLGFALVAGLKFGQLLKPSRYSERTTTTVLGPIAIAGSTDVLTQRAPASDRTWPTRWARARCIGRPVATMVRRPLTCAPSGPPELGAKLTASMVSARTGS